MSKIVSAVDYSKVHREARISKYPAAAFMTKLVFRVISNEIFTFSTKDLLFPPLVVKSSGRTLKGLYKCCLWFFQLPNLSFPYFFKNFPSM